MMHRLTALRRAQQEARARFTGEPLIRPVFTGTARRGYTPSDLEALESVSVVAEKPNGDALPLAGYDDITSYP